MLMLYRNIVKEVVMKLSVFMRTLCIICFVFTLGCSAAEKKKELSPRELRTLVRLVSEVLRENHFRGAELDRGEIASKLFDEYFLTLDPGKTIFSQADIKQFEHLRPQLDSQLERGEYQFALDVYDLYRTRQQEFRKFAEERLKKPFDFTVDEEFVTKVKDLPRPADRKALAVLWEKKLKNDVLYYRLFNRALEEGRKERAGKAGELKGKEAQKFVHDQKVEQAWKPKSPEERLLHRLRDVNNEIKRREKVEIIGIYLNTLAQLYGPHSNYMPPALDEDFEINMRLSLTGIGATLTSDDGYIKIVSLVPGGPAAKHGKLKEGDRIVAVTQEDGSTTDVIDMPVSKAVKFIRGEVNTKVTLTILAGEKGPNAVPEQITIVREKVQLVDSAAKGKVEEITLPDGTKKKIGMIDLPSFYNDFEAESRGEKDFRSCSRDVEKLLREFEQKNVDAVVMDMRRNGGGYLMEAIRLSGLFITVGPVVQVQNSNKRIGVEFDKDPKIVWRKPLVVLTSKLSASSTEIFAGAIRDLDRGILAGDSRTFGKGTVLNVLPVDRWLKGGGSVTYETAMFFRSAGGSVQQLGIQPDVIIPSLTEEMEIGEMFMDNHLPWNTIRPVRRLAFDPMLGLKAEKLRMNSAKRIAADKDFAVQQKRLALFKKYRDRKSVSLNEKKRWEEYQSEKLYQEELEKMYSEDEKKNKLDPVLKEAANIAADLAAM